MLVVGDLFETAAPPPEATAVVYDALLALRETGAHVVVVGGNHDQQSQLDAVAPVFARLGITVLGLPAGPDRAVVDVAGARVVMLPWMSQRWAIKTEQLMGATAAGDRAVLRGAGRAPARVAERGLLAPTRSTSSPRTAWCRAASSAAANATPSSSTSTRCPRRAFPASANYVALGHLHRAQQMPGAAPIWYSGSPIQVDFGEEPTTRKQVLVVDIPDRGRGQGHARSRSHAAGSAAHASRGTLAELEAAAPTSATRSCASFVREQPRPGLADDVRALLPQRGRRARRARRRRRDAAEPRRRSAPDCDARRATCSRQYLDDDRPRRRRPRSSRCSTSCSTPTCSRRGVLMRPVELVIEGFGPFRDRVTVDFADADLFAIVGATGHGKSSMIDAICFALYGKVPRHGDKDIAPGHDARLQRGARVADVRRSARAATSRRRIVRRKADGDGAKHPRAAPRAVNDDGTTEMLAGSVREFDPRSARAPRPRLRPVHEVRRAPPGPVRRVPAGDQRRAQRDPRRAARSRPLRPHGPRRARARRAGPGRARGARAGAQPRTRHATRRSARSTRCGPPRRARRAASPSSTPPAPPTRGSPTRSPDAGATATPIAATHRGARPGARRRRHRARSRTRSTRPPQARDAVAGRGDAAEARAIETAERARRAPPARAI